MFMLNVHHKEFTEKVKTAILPKKGEVIKFDGKQYKVEKVEVEHESNKGIMSLV